jgi:hypothetical protein
LRNLLLVLSIKIVGAWPEPSRPRGHSKLESDFEILRG